ncbi:hypothetical protein Ae201684P_022034 [Aphanomyces euteiches]|uniref:SET domain-containing protein n=1 Tax=Aphanomyces euteiches TaxID=100861 RepID=A0A6G0W7A9_9STRA|nr:hypothetical protein Ae201684_018060 [Aphanomyces euteiches]KAH9072456.1 hypothetical protein Ae201684P_022034 [Aphanomyces euteiches]KAH9146143.1 hypothetical protein AeRB84_009954 [Aphanomyces euteiches]
MSTRLSLKYFDAWLHVAVNSSLIASIKVPLTCATACSGLHCTTEAVPMEKANAWYEATLERVKTAYTTAARLEASCSTARIKRFPEGIARVPSVVGEMYKRLVVMKILPPSSTPAMEELDRSLTRDVVEWLKESHGDHLETILAAVDSSWLKGPFRHCALCLVALTAPKLCSKCLRRAYCSRRCQRMDWAQAGQQLSQGHKHWCGLAYGEEDIEWEVIPIAGKGLGVVAKKAIARFSRILVEGVLFEPVAALADLMPRHGSLLDKFLLNCMDSGGNPGVSLRLCRANHACDANASHVFDATYGVKVLYAERDIAPGDEICISYTMFDDVLQDKRPDDILRTKWNIVCDPVSCPCVNPQVLASLVTCRCLYATIERLIEQKRWSQALAALRKIQAQPAVHHVMTTWTLCNDEAMVLACLNRHEEASACMAKALKLCKAIYHPASPTAIEWQERADRAAARCKRP